ncbi:hypothetical protein [Citrobacter sp.]|uniref:hypothetical protein n=1 Tax=Citrobacter sp. TaxID=1896336 RepID=UPI002900FDCB|nr:hypothetical protein [Citrobacter sp.]MDU1873753.1 hypothetical protein [Citrobacter sp.]
MVIFVLINNLACFQTMRNKNDPHILRLPLLLLFTCTLTGCALTRVSDGAHAQEVDSLNVIGLSLDAARQRATERGFVCSNDGNLNTVVTDDGEHRWLQTECSKKSAEQFCPQTRYVVLNVDPETNNVVDVGKYIDQNTCF